MSCIYARKYINKLWIAFSSVLLVGGAVCCGGGGGDGDATSGSYTANEVQESVLKVMSEDEASGALLLALDKGYSIGQIADAAINDRLTVEGDVLDIDGAVLQPAYSSSAMIVSRTLRQKENDSSEQGVMLSELLEEAKEHSVSMGMPVFLFIVSLANNGYSGEQIIDGLLLGRIVRIDYQVTLQDVDGNDIAPARAGDAGTLDTGSSSSAEPTPTPASEESSSEDVEEGEESSETSGPIGTWSYSINLDYEVPYVSAGTMTFNEDGTVTGYGTLTNLSTGDVREVTSAGQWQLEGNQLSVEFPAEDSYMTGSYQAGDSTISMSHSMGYSFVLVQT